MKKNDPSLENFIRDYLESKEDFIAIHWKTPFSQQESLVRYKLQNKKLPKSREWNEEKGHWEYFWPGLSPRRCVKLLKSYSWGQREDSTFFCVYRINHVEDLESKIEEMIPEENRERIG